MDAKPHERVLHCVAADGAAGRVICQLIIF